MRTWNDWSDLEVNRKVAEVLGKKVVQHSMIFEGKIWVIEGEDGIERLPDYCNDIVHAWPIVYENEITIQSPDYYQDGMWHVSGSVDSDYGTKDCYSYKSNNEVIRSEMIVFLMMNGVEENGE